MLSMNGLFLGAWKHPLERGVGPCFPCYPCNFFSLHIFVLAKELSDLLFGDTIVVFLVYNFYIVQHRGVRGLDTFNRLMTTLF